MATATVKPTRKGRAKVWTRPAMIAAGVQYVKDTGRRPSVSAWSRKGDGRPTANTVIGEYGKWSTYITQVARAYRKATGQPLPAAAKPGSINGFKPRAVDTPTPPAPPAIDSDESIYVPPAPRKGFWRSLFS